MNILGYLPVSLLNATEYSEYEQYYMSPTIYLSAELKKLTGWWFTRQKARDLYWWIIKRYGPMLNMDREVGKLLRTMDTKSYVLFMNYVSETKTQINYGQGWNGWKLT
jgi:hypothetical protein